MDFTTDADDEILVLSRKKGRFHHHASIID